MHMLHVGLLLLLLIVDCCFIGSEYFIANKQQAQSIHPHEPARTGAGTGYLGS